ncbi:MULTISPECIES: NAD(P)/FAD-dependent oxidoreductase [unclassified Cellulophaga]|uniref:NAD(P)/FAD-dependent oxidoreductase n=1 Tax=unclassified Cellulophaga TaxID=2634405 RepID=UPI0026E22A05|nr:MULTISPECIES: FAD-dependent oxidoreductase [unclassified Cellulophaga]MDO6491301.1 FAD-dependent oxidoreductase [Cellulophaga sp. 2_MG-2023]MDO6495166.1 FAD-dependent oxidoreductase [Cellulophaga sp. 3_MG-2023]
MNFSYWEHKTWLSAIDFTIVGSGIVGLNCALYLKERFPKAKILILEKGMLPQGASTKNAGFACFGSISEIVSDLDSHTEEEVVELVQKRLDGINLLRSNLGDKAIGYKNYGGHELFLESNSTLYQHCLSKLSGVNTLLNSVFKGDAFVSTQNKFNFNKIQKNYITHIFEAQIDTGKMMQSLLAKVIQKGILILNNTSVKAFTTTANGVAVETNNFTLQTKKLVVATNGFAAELLQEKVKPARAQVLVTSPIPNLHIKGTFHLDKGYYYFRNIDDRILFGGGRNLDFKAEETSVFGETKIVQQKLEEILRETILPNTPFKIDKKWSGIMGVGSQKNPIIKEVEPNVYCGVRLGGMGIAIGSLVGKELADKVVW